MTRGGRRTGAGRKKGTPNKKNAETIKAIAASGITPLEYMLNLMRGEPPADANAAQQIAFEAMRFEAAKAAAPYVHPKLASVEHKGEGGGPIDMHWTVELVRPGARLAK